MVQATPISPAKKNDKMDDDWQFFKPQIIFNAD